MSSALTAAGVLGGTFFLGVPLNGGTVLIFLRRKKLRHLVNFLLLLDSLSHLLVTFLAIPTRLISTVLFDEFVPLDLREDFLGDFANIHGTLLTLSIGILRYRRLCWKKKDGFCLINGLKWSLANGILALGLTIAQSAVLHFSQMDDGGKRLNLIFYTVKSTISISSVFVLVWCYSCVCWRVLGNSSNQEKLRRSRSVHIRAMVHSVIQVLLLASTIASFIYTESLQLYQTPSASQKLNLLYGTTANYALLLTGTPLAYLASCHRFREEFGSLFFGSVPRRLFHKISSDKSDKHKENSSPRMHLITISNGNGKNGMRHKVVGRRPSTPRTMTSTTSSSTSSTATAAAAAAATHGLHVNIASVHVPGNKSSRPHHLPGTKEIRTEFMSSLSLYPYRKGSPGHHYAPTPSPVDFI